MRVCLLQKTNEQRGFTLISGVLALLLLSCTFYMVTPLLKHLSEHSERVREDPFAASQFFHFLQEELYHAERIEAHDSKLLIYPFSELPILYEQYFHIIRRKVNNSGHEVMLMDVQSVNFVKTPSCLQITIDLKSGDKVERCLSVPLQTDKQ